MRAFWTMTLLALVASSAAANPGGGGTEPPPTTNPPPTSTVSGTDAPQVATGRQEAERSYGQAYEEIAKAKKDLEAGKTKNADKRYKRALESAERATALDARYHEAWNLVGYAARKLKDYPKAFAAYEKCLAVKPDYAPAREYMGEAYLERGDLTKAREQLVLLERLSGEEDAKDLRAAIEIYEKAHPELKAPPPPPPATPAAADTTTGRGQ
jgi:tetratricopeptide (TPR) repeat protein